MSPAFQSSLTNDFSLKKRMQYKNGRQNYLYIPVSDKSISTISFSSFSHRIGYTLTNAIF